MRLKSLSIYPIFAYRRHDRLVELLRQSSDKDHSIRREPIAPAIGLMKTKIEK
jgi:hypothetical protein